MSPSLREIDLGSNESILVYGIGNVGRQDDGIGIILVDRLERDALYADDGDACARLTFEAGYQLSIEDALLVSGFDVVLFIDASRERVASEPFTLRALAPSDQVAFTTHAMSFSSVLGICADLYSRSPRTFLLAVSGYEWGISERLSLRAGINIDEAFASLSELLRPRRRSLVAQSRGLE
jgi:hydrogenase maturation protease